MACTFHPSLGRQITAFKDSLVYIEFQDSLGSVERPCLNTKQNKMVNRGFVPSGYFIVLVPSRFVVLNDLFFFFFNCSQNVLRVCCVPPQFLLIIRNTLTSCLLKVEIAKSLSVAPRTRWLRQRQILLVTLREDGLRF